VKRINFLAAFASLLALITLLGCANVAKLQSIDLSASGSTGTVEVKGAGGTLQLQAIGNYSTGATRDLTSHVTYSLTVTPNSLDVWGNQLLAPPADLTVNPTGQLTAVEPFVCTFHDAQTDPTQPPVWVLTGTYTVVVSLNGVSSQPMYIPVASATGDGPGGACGP
jgi:hypothetical protein